MCVLVWVHVYVGLCALVCSRWGYSRKVSPGSTRMRYDERNGSIHSTVITPRAHQRLLPSDRRTICSTKACSRRGYSRKVSNGSTPLKYDERKGIIHSTWTVITLSALQRLPALDEAYTENSWHTALQTVRLPRLCTMLRNRRECSLPGLFDTDWRWLSSNLKMMCCHRTF